MFIVLEEALVHEACRNYVCLFYSAVVMEVEVTSFRREMHTLFPLHFHALASCVYVSRISSTSSLVVCLVMVAVSNAFLPQVFIMC
jgi:hypothetical protein